MRRILRLAWTAALLAGAAVRPHLPLADELHERSRHPRAASAGGVDTNGHVSCLQMAARSSTQFMACRPSGRCVQRRYRLEADGALRHPAACRPARSLQAIAKAEAVTRNAARLVRAPTLCLCKAPGEEGPGGADAPRPLREPDRRRRGQPAFVWRAGDWRCLGRGSADSSGHCNSSSASCSVGLAKLSRFLGRSLSSSATAPSSASVTAPKSVPLGKYWRSRPLVFSFEPRCQGACGSLRATSPTRTPPSR